MARRSTHTAKARGAILEVLQAGGWLTVRDIKHALRDGYGIDMEATAQRIYELRMEKHGGHDIPCSMRRVRNSKGKLQWTYGYQFGNGHHGDTEARRTTGAEGEAMKQGTSAGEPAELSGGKRCIAEWARAELAAGKSEEAVQAKILPYDLDELLAELEAANGPKVTESVAAAGQSAGADVARSVRTPAPRDAEALAARSGLPKGDQD